jgi:hypothetical protein
MDQPFPGYIPIEFFILPAFFLLVVLLVVLAAIERWRREKHRLELQKAILERVGTVKDLGEFLTTEQGERFLGSLAPPQFRPQLRMLSAVGTGIVFLVVGLFLMFALHIRFFGVPARTQPPAALVGILLLIAIGIGMLVSAAVSFIVARRLGLNGGRNRGSSKSNAGQ